MATTVAVRAFPRTSSDGLRVRLIGNSSKLLNHNNLHDASSLGDVASRANLLVGRKAQSRLGSGGRWLDIRDLGVRVLLEDATGERRLSRRDGGAGGVGEGGDDDGGRLVGGWGALDDVSGAGGELDAAGEVGDGADEVIDREDGG